MEVLVLEGFVEEGPRALESRAGRCGRSEDDEGVGVGLFARAFDRRVPRGDEGRVPAAVLVVVEGPREGFEAVAREFGRSFDPPHRGEGEDVGHAAGDPQFDGGLGFDHALGVEGPESAGAARGGGESDEGVEVLGEGVE